ncbi:MAG: YkvA family protein [Desulfocapsaceae bacterium]|nr:YkvA family protein [Desulfocapsaceae bacterium]
MAKETMNQDSDSTWAKKVKESDTFKKAENTAQEYINNPGKLEALFDEASKKANGKQEQLNVVWVQLLACFRLIKAYAKGQYRKIPWRSLVMIIASVLYFVWLVDLVPDFIPFLGFLDDAAILGWTLKTFKSDIDDFTEWESSNE